MQNDTSTPGIWPPIQCSTGACVAISREGDRFIFTSTLGTDRGRTEYDAAEVATFLADVKAGKWDGVLATAEQLATVRV